MFKGNPSEGRMRWPWRENLNINYNVWILANYIKKEAWLLDVHCSLEPQGGTQSRRCLQIKIQKSAMYN